MPNTDFIDEDLMQGRDSGRRIQSPLIGEERRMDLPPNGATPHQEGGRFNRRQEEVDAQVARATEELERLRKRQEDLEREKRLLQEMRSKQETFEAGRNEMLEQLGKSLLAIGQDEIRNEQAINLLSATRKRFKEMLAEIEELDATKWSEERVRDELGRALGILENVSLEYKKSVAKVQAISSHLDSNTPETTALDSFASVSRTGKDFLHYLNIGFAVSLPLILTFLLIALLSFILQSRGLI